MKPTHDRRRWAAIIAALACLLPVPTGWAQSAARVAPPDAGSLWAHDNLIAWCVAPWDAKKRGPEERAQMLARLGFKHYAYISLREETDAELDAEIRALKKHGINLIAWYFPWDADNPRAKELLEVFQRHGVRPQLWVALPPKQSAWPKNQEEWAQLVPEGPSMPKNWEDTEKLSEAEQARLRAAVSKIAVWVRRQDMPKTPSDQQDRLRQEADRIDALVKLARPYGVKVALYNHNGWFGMMDSQVAIIENLQQRGVADVGIVYNFSHARDDLHDDSKDFPAIWKRMQPYVVAVNVTGMRWEGEYIYPSQGDSELDMMGTIQASGWRGHVGVIAEKGGDAEITLRNYLVGLDWLAAELKQPGSGGPRPFPPVH
jgi:sugar phosphate isomerase/epimerase